MPLKNGELNASELRRLIKKHNQLMSIKIPPKTNRDGLIKLIESNGYKINHTGQKLEPSVKMKRKPIVKLPPAPAKKTAEEKAEAKKKKQSKAEKQEEEAFESRKKKIEAIKKLRKNKTQPKKEEPKKDIKDNLINTNIEKKTMAKKKPVEKADSPNLDEEHKKLDKLINESNNAKLKSLLGFGKDSKVFNVKLKNNKVTFTWRMQGTDKPVNASYTFQLKKQSKTQPKKEEPKKEEPKSNEVSKEVFSSIKSPTDIINSAKIKEALKEYIGEKNTLKLTKDMNTNKALLFIFEKKEGISIPEIKKRYDSLPKNVKDNFALRFYGLNNETYNP